MIEYIALSVVGVFSLFAFYDWYKGIWLVLLTGFLQDPIRKMIPDQPAYMVALAAVVFVAVVAGLAMRGFSFRPSVIPGWKNGVAQAVTAFVILLVLQLANAYFNYGSLFLIGIGALAYIAPLFAIFTGYYFACRNGIDGLLIFVRLYCLLCLIFASGIYLEYFGLEFSALGEVGAGLTIYDLGTVLNAFSGFFRSSELAAWHIFCGSSLMLILLLRSKSNIVRAIWFLAIIFVITGGLLTGRRKMLVTVILFGSVYWLLTFLYLKQTLKMTAILFLLSIAGLGSLSQSSLINRGENQVFDLYVERSSGVFGDIGGRVEGLGFKTVISAIKEFGLFGKGAGAASQGSRFSGTDTGSAWQAEGGLGRIVVELGLVGLILLLWMSYLIAVQFRKTLIYLSRKDPLLAQSCIGFIAFLVANFMNFFIASQVFGDPFVLIIIGLTTGFIASYPMQVYLQEHRTRIPRTIITV